jgi:uncharacterized protein (DUF58 family)
VQWAYAYEPQSRGTDLFSACHWLRKSLKKRSVIFLLSDFSDENFIPALKQLSQRHEVIAVQYQEPSLPEELGTLGLLELQDPETGELFVMDLSGRDSLDRCRQQKVSSQERLQKEFFKAGVGRILLPHKGSLVAPFQRYFKKGG